MISLRQLFVVLSAEIISGYFLIVVLICPFKSRRTRQSNHPSLTADTPHSFTVISGKITTSPSGVFFSDAEQTLKMKQSVFGDVEDCPRWRHGEVQLRESERWVRLSFVLTVATQAGLSDAFVSVPPRPRARAAISRSGLLSLHVRGLRSGCDFLSFKAYQPLPHFKD